MTLEVKGIKKSYKYESNLLPVLRGVDFTFDRGKITSIVGPSGAGKSTLLHIMGGLDKPDGGSVCLNGRDIYALSDKDRSDVCNKEIGFVFQFYHLLPGLSAFENVVLPALIRHRTHKMKNHKEKAMDLLALVGLGDRVQFRSCQLSGGEQQRVAMARAMMNDPVLILCDEPTGNLDLKSGQGIIDLILKFNEEKKQTFVIVTHNDNIANISYSVAYIKDGYLKK